MYIGFTYNKTNLVSKIIAWVTKSKWSHCFIVIGPVGLYDYLIAESSMSGGVKFNLLSKYDNKKFELELINLTEMCDQMDLESVLPLIGHRYGYFQTIGFLIAKLLKLETNPFTDDIVCSELVYLFLKESSLSELVKDLNPNEVTPQDLYERLKLNG